MGTKKKRGLTKESYANCLIFHQLIIPIILHIRDRMERLVPRVFKKKQASQIKSIHGKFLMQMSNVMMWQDELYKLTPWLIILLWPVINSLAWLGQDQRNVGTQGVFLTHDIYINICPQSLQRRRSLQRLTPKQSQDNHIQQGYPDGYPMPHQGLFWTPPYNETPRCSGTCGITSKYNHHIFMIIRPCGSS